MSKTALRLDEKSEFVPICHHCHIVGHIRPNYPKLRSLSTFKVRPPSGKHGSSNTTYVCHHYGVSRHIHPNCFKLYPQKQVSKRSQVSSQGPTPLFGELLKVLSFLTQFRRISIVLYPLVDILGHVPFHLHGQRLMLCG